MSYNRTAAMEDSVLEALRVYLPLDRCQALSEGSLLPDHTHGAALFADISGFTPLTEALVRELGHQRGAEELTHHLDQVYDALIEALHRYRGSVIGFSGDAITCWFDASSGEKDETLQETALRAGACALAMQETMSHFTAVRVPSGLTLPLAMKAAVSAGPIRRFMVGDPDIQLMDVLAGSTVERLSAAEHLANRGDVVIDRDTAAVLGRSAQVSAWRHDVATGEPFAVLSGLSAAVLPQPWPALPPASLQIEQIRPWLLPPVYERLHSGLGEFLAEFRPVVTLFLRFAGIDYDHDEDAGAKLDAYIRWVQGVSAQYEGFLIQLTIGDKGSYLCVAFGAPTAHEDDPVRAVAAGEQLRKPPQELNFITEIQIGIAQGLMRTGAYGGSGRRTYGVMGDEINLAARLMQAAQPGYILASSATSQATEGVYVWKSLPDLRVKGKSEPVSIRCLTGQRMGRDVPRQAPKYALPMVGRGEELASIGRRLGMALEGRGQIVGFSAEAGMGKSRLIAEAIREAQARGFTSYIGECESYGTNISYLPWQNIWRDFFHLEPGRTAEDQMLQLYGELTRLAPDLAPRLPLLGIALGLSIPDNDLTRSFDAKLRKTSMEGLLVDCLRARAREKPLLIVLEDCHWLDPLSHDLLEVSGRAIADLPVVLLMAFRPAVEPHLKAPRVSALPNYTEIGLTDFAPQEAERLIHLKLEQFFGHQSETPPELVQRIIFRSEGNPFYIEELLNYLKDRGIHPQDRQGIEELELPTSLQSLILSRIDQLTESQVITLKVASVIGRLFKAAMLLGIYPQLGDQKQVISDLDTLSRMNLTELETADPELTYLFKHVITQEVTYESLPYATRAVLHEEVGKLIERSSPETLDPYIDLLAFHYERSNNEAKKREYLLRAGQAAQANYANSAAISYYRRVLPLLPMRERAEVMLKLGQVFVLVGEWHEASEIYLQTLDLAEDLGDRLTLAWCQAAIADLMSKQGHYADAADWLEQSKAAFQRLNDLAGVGQVLHSGGTLAAQQGNFDRASKLYQESLAIRRRLNERPRIASLLSNLAILARFQGNDQLALTLHEEGLAIRRELKDKWAIANSLNNLGNVALDQKDYEVARARLEEALSLLREVGDRWAIANTLNNLGNVLRSHGDLQAAARLYQESLAIYGEFGDKRALAYLLEDMAGLAALQGQAERTLVLAGGASSLRGTVGSPLSSTEQAKLEQLLAPSMRALDEAAQARARATGGEMTLDQIILYARSD
jgi:predicted ATPase/class 3 adenylate cyclase